MVLDPAMSNLIIFNNYIIKAFGEHSQIDVIFTDFSEAFERVDHYNILINILYK